MNGPERHSGSSCLFCWAAVSLFILNIPMSFLEEKIFGNRHLKDKKIAKKIARPVCMVLTLAIVIGVVVLVMFVVIPELTRTILSLGRTIQTFIPEAQKFLEDLFTDNREIQAWLLQPEPGCGKADGHCDVILPEQCGECTEFDDVSYRIHRERHSDFCGCLCFLLLCTPSERKAVRADEKSRVCLFPGKARRVDV